MRVALEELERSTNYTLRGATVDKDALGGGLFESVCELAERCEMCCPSQGSLPAEDRDLLDRVRRRGLPGVAVSKDGANIGGGGGVRHRDYGVDGSAAAGGEDAVQNMGAEFQLSLVGLPLIVRDLLNRLPLHNGPAPDLDVFLRHVKGLTLPPRPSAEEPSSAASEQAGSGGTDAAGQGGASWLKEGGGAESALEDVDSLVPLLGSTRGRAMEGAEDDGDDPFRKRQRAKLHQ